MFQIGVIRGSIPTCAGQPATKAWASRQRGLSPRVRGSLTLGIDCYAKQVYPHVCGAAYKVLNRSTAVRVYPHVCGAAQVSPGCDLLRRSIPTCAGQPGNDAVDIGKLGSIPTCAGQPMLAVTLALRIGLSPRVRGSQHNVLLS